LYSMPPSLLRQSRSNVSRRKPMRSLQPHTGEYQTSLRKSRKKATGLRSRANISTRENKVQVTIMTLAITSRRLRVKQEIAKRRLSLNQRVKTTKTLRMTTRLFMK
jgi:hypothetical protein